jgi:hypothetical protein
MIIGVCGFIGSGKNAASEYLQQKYNFQRLSFADSLKQAVSAVFGWSFELLQGLTPESREWRETVDPWWSEKLQIRGLTPRWVLQQWGTEVCRNNFHPDIWIASLENKLVNNNSDVVIDDCRFANEMKLIRQQEGILINIRRGELPEWYATAKNTLLTGDISFDENGDESSGFENSMDSKYPDVHISEWGWVNEKMDFEIENNGTLEELYLKLDNLLRQEKIKFIDALFV